MDLASERKAFDAWIEKDHHGGMGWLAENRNLRFAPEKLVPGTCRVISLRLNYLPDTSAQVANLKSANTAYISRYALGRDYHKLMRKRLAKLAQQIQTRAEELGIVSESYSRVFADSAPVLERPLAEKAGLGWTGKHSLIINEQDGSWFFLGEIFTNIPFEVNKVQPENHCGTCDACLKICPTDAFTAPYVLDARRCISYLTIEHDGPIPEEFREPMGNRIFGCDDCQIICPWNKAAPNTAESDFHPRHGLNDIELLELFVWDSETFLKNTEGSAIRRAGYEKWLSNIAIALGNAPQDLRIIAALEQKQDSDHPVLREHVEWALQRQRSNAKRKRKIKNLEKEHF